MRVVITGVPGTGKTSLAKEINKKMKWPVVAVNGIITGKKIWKGKDKFGSKIAQMKKLGNALKKTMKAKDVILEGHLACEFPLNADKVIVCRTKPSVLIKRLQKRKYPKEKRNENILAELLDYATITAERNYKPKIVFEIDTSKKLKKSVAELNMILKGKAKKKQINWGNALVSWVQGQSLKQN